MTEDIAPIDPMPLLFKNLSLNLNFFPGLSSVPANIDPIIVASAPLKSFADLLKI